MSSLLPQVRLSIYYLLVNNHKQRALLPKLLLFKFLPTLHTTHPHYSLCFNWESVNMPKHKSDEAQSTTAPKKKPHWSMGLLDSTKNPESVVKSDDLVVVIKDAYPKARFHYLIMPKADIGNLKALDESHVDLLQHMRRFAKELIKDEKHKQSNFKIGYHAEPSMYGLHLHVISDDMDSPCVKTKKHWNSFNTKFFLDSKNVIKSLKRNGKVDLFSSQECKSLLETPLKCHKCDYIPTHIPDLKKHILIHIEDASSDCN